MSVKIAAKPRKRSADPLQEQLRAKKQQWNEECSEFIADLNAFKPTLIAFKRGLNGRGDAKAALPISDIKNPLPEQVSSYLSVVVREFEQLANTFSTLAQEAGNIVQQQAQYSSTRRKPKSAATLSHSLLLVEASNPVSRLWAHLSSIFSADELKHYRLSMLSMFNNLFKNLLDFEDAILSKGVDNIPQVLKLYFLISNNVSALSLSAKKLLNTKPDARKSVKTDKPEIGSQTDKEELEGKDFDDESQKFDKMKSAMLAMVNTGLPLTNVRAFIDIYNKLKQENDSHRRSLMEDRLHEIYEETYTKLKNILETSLDKKLPDSITLEELINIKKKSSVTNDSLTVLGSNYFTRLLKYYRQRYGFKDPSTAARIEIYEHTRECKKIVDALMDLFEEKTINLEEVKNNMSELEEQIVKMGEPMKLLNILHKDKFYEKENKKHKDPYLDPAHRYFTRQVRRDIDKPGW